MPRTTAARPSPSASSSKSSRTSTKTSPVYLRNDNGYTYGNITERTIIPSEDLEEGDDE